MKINRKIKEKLRRSKLASDWIALEDNRSAMEKPEKKGKKGKKCS